LLKFTPFKQHQPGLLYDMLTECYSTLPELVKQEKKSWSDYDASVFTNPETIGKCGFVSCLQGTPIGFASWDPRNHPEYVIIGHNCVLHQYQRRGFGRLQVIEMLKRFETMKFAQVQVSTGDDPFFLPAQKMYLSCGFQETSREPHKQIPGFNIICYIKQLVTI
jgi:ribosomal protein S18 acetylase RimI-like enzyme